jgi:hypothetical protein
MSTPRERMRNTYQRRSELGLCVRCGKSSYPFARCFKCRVEQALKMQRRRKRTA